MNKIILYLILSLSLIGLSFAGLGNFGNDQNIVTINSNSVNNLNYSNYSLRESIVPPAPIPIGITIYENGTQIIGHGLNQDENISNYSLNNYSNTNQSNYLNYRAIQNINDFTYGEFNPFLKKINIYNLTSNLRNITSLKVYEFKKGNISVFSVNPELIISDAVLNWILENTSSKNVNITFKVYLVLENQITITNGQYVGNKSLIYSKKLNILFQKVDTICPECVNPTPILFKGSGYDPNKYNILVVAEGKTILQINNYMESIFGSGQFSVFKTKPFIGKENLFNIYYVRINQNPYGKVCSILDSTRAYNCGISQKNLAAFNMIFNKFNNLNVRGKIYFQEKTNIWPQVIWNDYNSRLYGEMHMNWWGTNVNIRYANTVDHSSFFVPNQFVRTFAHEFGHLFAGLEDEYLMGVRTNSILIPTRNCMSLSEILYVPLSSNKWSQIPKYNSSKLINISYFNGCKYILANYRGTNYSIMNNPEDLRIINNWSEGYGVINQYYINRTLGGLR